MPNLDRRAIIWALSLAMTSLMSCGLPPLDTGDQEEAATSSAQDRTPCFVTRVFDGDTLACDLNNNRRIESPGEHVRLLGIDAPETSHSAKLKHRLKPGQAPYDEPYAQEATRMLQSLALRHTVYLAWDVERVDRYGRSLAVIYPGAGSQASLNEALLKAGVVKTLFFPPNLAYAKRFRAAQKEARRARVGLWQSAR
ncbi:MAG: thermonuclease family protein [Vampirovibrionales bacterium]|nr:thermonuclease family protein [Vampirovibrionales bacterium]